MGACFWGVSFELEVERVRVAEGYVIVSTNMSATTHLLLLLVIIFFVNVIDEMKTDISCGDRLINCLYKPTHSLGC